MTDYEKAFKSYLCTQVTNERFSKMQKVLSQRTNYLRLVVEDLFQPHNASAILRTSDALGIQNIHIIEDKNAYRPNDEISLGSAQWLDLHHHKGSDGIEKCYANLKSKGYRIIATSPHKKAYSLDDLDLEKGPMALVLGTELTGLSEKALSLADEYVYVPMYGFVESFNISVCAAIILNSIMSKLRTSAIEWQYSEEAQEEILFNWLRKNIKHLEIHEKEFKHGWESQRNY